MRRIYFPITCLLLIAFFGMIQVNAGQKNNKALLLNGRDNDVRTGMKIIKAPWTLEAWIKGDGDDWKDKEVLFGGGEYSKFNTADNLPLMLEKGKLKSGKSGAMAEYALDDKWHHVAVTCDNETTKLYIDGKEVASKSGSNAILPSCIGCHEEGKWAFGGLMDEVRIWSSCLSEETLNKWQYMYLRPGHPDFSKLEGYYTFDNMQADSGVNWVGKGHQSYHLRVNKEKFKKDSELPVAVDSTNNSFEDPRNKQELFNAVTVSNEWDVTPGSMDFQLLKLRIAVIGSKDAGSVSELTLDFSGTSNPRDIKKISIYYDGQTAKGKERRLLSTATAIKNGKVTCTIPVEVRKVLSHGINYFLVTCDIDSEAKAGNIITAKVDSFEYRGKKVLPETSHDYIPTRVIPSSGRNADIITLLDWNIWHGGTHLGHQGVKRVIELIDAAKADIVTMQEAYGSQEEIAKTLGYDLHTASSKDNLAIYSKFPMKKYPAGKPFNSCNAVVTLKNNRTVFLNCCWLRYAYKPEYTCIYPENGLDPKAWEIEDAEYSLKDVAANMEKDVDPVLEESPMPVIIAGDFNSGSHLDWTAAAAPLHNGYGPVDLPTSRFMEGKGYKDSYRELNPDEVKSPGGTFAVIYGQLQASRIDYIYYKGRDIKAVASRIIRTAPEIDDVWPSDHAAVLTVFEAGAK